MKSASDYALRKAQLASQCDLERLRLQFALTQIRGALTAPAATQPTSWAAPVAVTLLGLALPAMGLQRVKGIVKVLTLALSGYRVLVRLRALSAIATPASAVGQAPVSQK